MPKTIPNLLADLRAEPSEGVLRNVLSDLLEHDNRPLQALARRVQDELRAQVPDTETARRARETNVRARILEVERELASVVGEGSGLRPRRLNFDGGRKRSQTARFGACVKAVRKTVKARKGSNAESAAIAICTKSLLHPRGRTIKRYKKGRLLTQKRRA